MEEKKEDSSHRHPPDDPDEAEELGEEDPAGGGSGRRTSEAEVLPHSPATPPPLGQQQQRLSASPFAPSRLKERRRSRRGSCPTFRDEGDDHNDNGTREELLTASCSPPSRGRTNQLLSMMMLQSKKNRSKDDIEVDDDVLDRPLLPPPAAEAIAAPLSDGSGNSTSSSPPPPTTTTTTTTTCAVAQHITTTTTTKAAAEDGDTGDSDSATAAGTAPFGPPPVGGGGGLMAAWMVTILIVSVGLVMASGFLAMGIRSSYREQYDQFERSADDTILRFQSAFQIYLSTAALIHNRCRNRNFTREDFRQLYEYVRASGLAFQAIQFDPRISRDERRDAENEAQLFYARHYPHVHYRGFLGVSNDTTNETFPQVESDYYYPVQYMEPIVGNEAAIGLDYHSSPSRLSTVESCLRTGKPALTDRLRFIQQKEKIFGVVLMHPGVPVSSEASYHQTSVTVDGSVAEPQPKEDDVWPRDISSIVIRIPDLIGLAMGNQGGDSAAYLFDPTIHDATDANEPLFLGGVHVSARGGASSALASASSDAPDPPQSTQQQRVLTFIPETKLSQVTKGHRYHKAVNVSAANKVWTVVVVAVDGTFRPRLVFVFLSSAMILLASAGLAYWNYSYTERVVKFNAIKAAAEADRQALILESARQAAVAERELNDFIAHEVRNPVAAAMSACSFVKHAVNDPNPLSTAEARDNAKDDVEVISNALNFVHDLLRNMLDIHRAANKDLVIHLKPTDLLRDVLEPVAAMLHQRRSRIQFLLECPEDLHVNTDHLRLKQIVLNLSRNSSKFVDVGFIRLRAVVVDGLVEISVEDSGPGIPVSKRSRLFSKFQESLDTLSQGTGIGLYLCKNLTELMGGELVLDTEYDSGVPGHPGTRFVVKMNQPPVDPLDLSRMDRHVLDENDVGGGSREFHFRLDESDGDDDSDDDDADDEGGEDRPDRDPDPLDGASASRGAADTTSLDGGGGSLVLPPNLNVLFVDDDAILRKLFARKIRTVAPDWTVREAANGETALLLVERDAFDLIFMDQYMASVEKQLLGTETVQALRSMGVNCRICGLSANDKEVDFLQAGADVFCIKPFPCEAKAMRRELRRILNL